MTSPRARAQGGPRAVQIAALGLAASITAAPVRAPACGASGGDSVDAYSCSIAAHEEATRKKWRAGAVYSFTSTTILFDDGVEADQTRHIALATLAYRPTREWTLTASSGSLFSGGLEVDRTAYEFAPGIVAALGASWRALDAEGLRPFVVFAGQLSYADAPTKEVSVTNAPSIRYRAVDLRLGATAGWPIGRLLTPYALARGFGGPVFWRYQGESQVGTDAYKYQLGAGLSLILLRWLDLFVEGAPLGERGVTAGTGVSF
jgi:hypothetical protein